MFGNNPIRKKDKGDGTTLRVQQVWDTIQGEGPLAGTPAVFVRLAGCNLACWFCDTDFESNYDNVVSVDELIPSILKNNRSLVVLTGGEPLRQNLYPLIHKLLDVTRVQIETAGTLWDPRLEVLLSDDLLSVVVSPKTPKLDGGLRRVDASYKYIIKAGETDPDDGLPITNTQSVVGIKTDKDKPQPLARPHKHAEVFVQPCDEGDPVKNRANLDECVRVARQHGYRLSLQIHKLIGME